MRIIAAASASELLLAGKISSIASGIADCIRVLADHYAAAAKYERLSRLCDAELQRRGLSRATLARDVLATCNRHPA